LVPIDLIKDQVSKILPVDITNYPKADYADEDPENDFELQMDNADGLPIGAPIKEHSNGLETNMTSIHNQKINEFTTSEMDNEADNDK
jgi:hypothetical protein